MRPETRPATIALAGNPNAGKTTFFNALTGARQHVGNYPGVTVEKKEGDARLDGVDIHIVDLPGAYSLTAYTQEEIVARRFLVEERPDAVLHVVDSGTLERGLYLTVQFLELGVPTALSLNMMDEAKRAGMVIDHAKLGELMGVVAVPTTARAGLGVADSTRAALAVGEKRLGEPWRPLVISYGPDLDPVLEDMTGRIESAGLLTHLYPARWTAIKLLERDADVLDAAKGGNAVLSAELVALVDKAAKHCRDTLRQEPDAIIADHRYGFIASVLKGGALTKTLSLEERIAYSDRADQVLTHRVLGPIIMLAVLYAVYKITFEVGQFPMDWLEAGFDALAKWTGGVIPEGPLNSLVVNGVIKGVGGVLNFTPLILIIFFLIAALEDSGYMARIAYMLDRVFRLFGLHGCSVMPLILGGGVGGGCAVPGVMAARTLRSPKEKLATILVTPFMTCGAKLPVFILLVGVIFPGREPQALFCITLAGWVLALLAARLIRSTVASGAATPFVMELPPYRMPTLRGMSIHAYERVKEYVKKASTFILAVSILVWAGMTFPAAPKELLDQAEATALVEIAKEKADQASEEDKADAVKKAQAEAALEHSAAGRIGRALEAVSTPLGFDWRINIALAAGFAAKEVIVSTLGVAYALGEVDADDAGSLQDTLKADPAWTLARGLSLILFVLIYAPCLVTVAVVRQETGSTKWAVFSLVFNTVVAYGLAAAVYQIASRL